MQTNPLAGVEQPNTMSFTVKPIQISIPAINPDEFLNEKIDIRIESIDPTGRKYNVQDNAGVGQWSMEWSALQNGLQIQPSTSSYAGPVQVLINNKIVDRYSRLIPGSRELILEKILSTKLVNGVELNVHYTDFSLEKIEDKTYPFRVLQHMRRSYDILKRELALDENHPTQKIDIYLGDTDDAGLYPFGGFEMNDFKRAPLFVIRNVLNSDRKDPAILLPMDYEKFLHFWNEINQVPSDVSYSVDDYLASSIIHEMTHALIHDINENLGSTEHEIRNGDWFTEGIARYFETKVNSDPGFASMGFRERTAEKLRFSRGGANYFLRYPDESFFNQRYESALFWMFMEKNYGSQVMQEMSHKLDDFPYDATIDMYMDVFESITKKDFTETLHEFHDWVYLKEYKKYKEGKHLEEVAMTKSLWADGYFNILTKNGEVVSRERNLNTDWISYWSTFKSSNGSDYVAGDLTQTADLNPLTADYHEIMVQKDMTQPLSVTVFNGGKSSEMRISFYIETKNGMEKIEHTIGKNGRAIVQSFPLYEMTKIGLVISNLDPQNTTTYSIEVK